MESKERIRTYIAEELDGGIPAGQIGDDFALLDGLLDSVSILRLVGFLEDEFSVVIEDQELIPENFGSVNRIVEFVESKRSG